MSRANQPTHNKSVSVRPQVVVYVKPEHKPSTSAVATLERIRKQIPFDLEQIDITGDPKLTKKHGSDVPVVLIDGERAFKGRVPEAAFKKRVKKANGAERPSPAESTPRAEAPSAKRVPWGAKAAVLATVVLGVGFFISRGIAEANYGRGRLARALLNVVPRDEPPIPFNLEKFDGAKVLSDQRFRGKVVFVNFWATWCPPCVEEMPSMLRLSAKMKDDPRFDMVAISTDEGWDPVKKFFEQPPPFDVLLDKEGKLAKKYGTDKFPETYIVVDGRLVGHIIGPRDWDTWYAEAYLRAITEHGEAL